MPHRSVLWWTLALVVAFTAGVVVNRYLFPTPGNGPALDAIDSDHVHAAAKYVCPMHPDVISDKPGTCPICGMALVPVKSADAHTTDEAGEPTVRIEPEVVNNLGVKIAPVVRTTLARRIEAPGFVQQIDAGRRARVLAPFDAKVAALQARPGQWLAQGKPFLTLESAALRMAEQAHVALLQTGALPSVKPGGAASGASAGSGETGMTLEASRQSLASLGLSDDAIRKLELTRTPSAQLTLYTPYAGMITNLRVAAGDSVKSGTMLCELSGMAHASVLANAFQRDAAWIQTGQPVKVRLPHVSNQVWTGVVNQAAVSIDPNSQNIGVRLSFSAPPQFLKSAMYVVATIYGDAHKDVLAVPQQAVIRTETEDRVIVALGGGRFKPVPVHIGIETGDAVEILSGLKEGDQVVVSAQFLIDSESSLQASYLRMTGQ